MNPINKTIPWLNEKKDLLKNELTKKKGRGDEEEQSILLTASYDEEFHAINSPYNNVIFPECFC